ncbi:MAG: hypothetical protein ACREQZ_05645 [Woeseiaceae bacterium]
MNAKTLPALAAALLVTSLPLPAIADSPGEHPAVLVAATWSSAVDPNTLGLVPNTFVFLHPAGPMWVDKAPTVEENNVMRDPPPLVVSANDVSNQ